MITKNGSRGIYVGRDLLQSKAYWSLSAHAMRVLLRFYEKRKMKDKPDSKGNRNWMIINNGNLVFTYKEAIGLGMNGKQFSKAIDDLISFGFLEITHQGAGQGDPSKYKLTERWKAYGKDCFNPAPARRRNTDPNWGWNIHNKKSTGKKDTAISGKKDTKMREGE